MYFFLHIFCLSLSFSLSLSPVLRVLCVFLRCLWEHLLFFSLTKLALLILCDEQLCIATLEFDIPMYL